MIEIDNKDIQIFINAMKVRSCYDFSNYSMSSLKRRIGRILIDNNMNIDLLNDKIGVDRAFTEYVVKKITVCTTELFRDPEMWISLRDEMLSTCNDKTRLHIWHAGCSTGQEVYSMMIILNELNLLQRSDIYATDLNQDALDLAVVGKYKYLFNKIYLENFDRVINTSSQNYIVKKKVSYSKYFTVDPVMDTIQMKSFLAEKPVYRKTDLVRDVNPFNVAFDIIICRNVIIYFNYELQNKVFDFFYRNLSDNGCLLLGSHESIIGPSSSAFEKKFHGYFKKSS